MNYFIKFKKITLYLVIVSCFTSFLSAQNSKKFPPEKPKLIVALVIDQMKNDYIYKYWNKFENTGFKKIIGEGAYCRNTNYDYIFTQTGVGHATIFTGAMPSYHGIISNYWYNRTKDIKVYCVDDDKVKSTGTKNDFGKKSPRKLLTTTIGDELKLSTAGNSKVISISLKDRAAIIPGGHTANGAWWFDTESGNWITSSYYMDTLPKWVKEFNEKNYPDLYIERQWTPILPIEQYTESLEDNNKYEVGFLGNKITFPYDLKTMRGDSKSYELLLSTPFGNTLTKDFALAAILNENLGKGSYTDFLSVSFSSTDYIGHSFGPSSIEVEDTYIRLDKEIAHFLEFIDTNFGKENVLVFLTSDHGISEVPKYLIDKKIPAGYFNYNYAITLLKSYLNAVYGYGEWVKTYMTQQIYLNRILIEDSKLDLEDVQNKVAQFFVQFTGVANATTATALQNSNFTNGINEKMKTSYNQNRSGDVLVNLEPGWIEENSEATTHNSAYTYDTHVPLIWYGWKINRKTITRKISISEIAPTISTLLNIPFPNGCMSEPIIELTE
ncbi:MAG: hypothetical protein A2046_15570 [Bacteroidetes bacterium GWA2_30_7]|nr:MAG: hypothetical protein A2046_15570 [Bacteroidetes bacterium GWA2_30_7]